MLRLAQEVVCAATLARASLANQAKGAVKKPSPFITKSCCVGQTLSWRHHPYYFSYTCFFQKLRFAYFQILIHSCSHAFILSYFEHLVHSFTHTLVHV